MSFNSQGYKNAIQNEFTIVSKKKVEVPFVLNRAQDHFLQQLAVSLKIVVLKARKMGFSSVALAIAVLKLLLGENERCVSMSFDATASGKQLERAKHFIRAFEIKNHCKIPFKYNSKNELVYEGISKKTGRPFTNTLRIGTAKSGSFGRGDDITFLHLTEVAFCTNLPELLAGVGEACIDDAPKILETTANGFGEFKKFWDDAMLKKNGYLALFYGPDWEYDEAFLREKEKNLGRLFKQEYPRTAIEAFITTGNPYFNGDALNYYLESVKNVVPIQTIQ